MAIPVVRKKLMELRMELPDRSQMVITSADLEACPPEELTDVVS